MTIKECIITDRNARRDNTRRRSMSLGEEYAGPLTCPITTEQIEGVLDWLDVENSKRYQPGNGQTHCNIFVHDFMRTIGLYVPRVWWTDPYSVTADTVPVYGANCREMSANALCKWMRQHGPDFGWKLSNRPITANTSRGEIGVVIGMASSGHGHTQVLYDGWIAQAGVNNYRQELPYSIGFWERYADVVWAISRGNNNVG